MLPNISSLLSNGESGLRILLAPYRDRIWRILTVNPLGDVNLCVRREKAVG